MDSENTAKEYDPQQLEPTDMQMIVNNPSGNFLEPVTFERMQRAAKVYCESEFVPAHFRGKMANVLIAMDMAMLMNMNAFMLMRTMYIVHGKPGFEAKFTIALINKSGLYEDPLEYEWKGERGKPSWGCRAFAIRKSTGKTVYGPWVDWQMVLDEKWNQDKPYRDGKGMQRSKWNTMPEIMFVYRAATFFGRVNNPDLLMGMQTVDELEDIGYQNDLVKLPSGSYGVPENNDKKQKIDYSATQKPPEPEEKSNVVELKKKPDAEAEAPAEQPGPLQDQSPQEQKRGERDEFGMPVEHPLAKSNWFDLRRGDEVKTGLKVYLQPHVELFADLTEAAYERLAFKYKKIYGRDITELTEVIEDDQGASGDVEKPEVEIQPGHPDLAKPPAMSQQEVIESEAATALGAMASKHPAEYKAVVANQIPQSIEQIHQWMMDINQLVVDNSQRKSDGEKW